MGEAPALRSVFAPAYHAVGAVLAPWLGLDGAVKAFAFASAAALIAGFRYLQRSAGLPDAAAALFAWAPYGFALSWCLPKVEAAGYALAFAGLGLLWRRRLVGAAACLAATFWVHTAAALFFGLCGGVFALAQRDRRALLALAAGTLGAVPLLAVHLSAGCTLAQALLLSPGDYLRTAGRWSSLAMGDRILALAGPIAVGCGVAGAARLWRDHRAVALVAAAVTALYLSEIWLAPFGVHTTFNLLRGLTAFAFPVAAAGGVFLASRPRWAAAVVAACALWGVGTALWVVPGSCHRVPIDVAEVTALDVDRCAFRWRLRVGR
jgi:hypothetical protein